jgi:hypothetical protein
MLSPTALSTRQLLYIIVLQCIGASALDAGLLFALHVLIFKNAPKVELWPFPTTIAGDLWVSLILTSTLTFVIAGAMVWGDVIKGSNGPLRIAPLTLLGVNRIVAHGGYAAWMLTVSPVFDADTWVRAGVLTGFERSSRGAAELVAAAPPRSRWFTAAGANAARGAAFGVLLSIIVWPIAVGICAATWGNDGYSSYPVAPTIFCVYGCIIGAIITPVVATLALATAGRAAPAYCVLTAVPSVAAENPVAHF